MTSDSGPPSVILGHYLRVEQVGVDNSTFDIIQVGIVFQRPLQKACLLTQLGNVSTVIVGEHLVAQNGISNLCKTNGNTLNQPKKSQPQGHANTSAKNK